MGKAGCQEPGCEQLAGGHTVRRGSQRLSDLLSVVHGGTTQRLAGGRGGSDPFRFSFPKPGCTSAF